MGVDRGVEADGSCRAVGPGHWIVGSKAGSGGSGDVGGCWRGVGRRASLDGRVAGRRWITAVVGHRAGRSSRTGAVMLAGATGLLGRRLRPAARR
ncbi:hypothetical protein ACLOJK_026832 [Asimina triloba]